MAEQVVGVEESHIRRRLEQAAWIAFVACVTYTPLSVAAFPFNTARIVVSPFAFPQTVALAVGVAIALGLWGGALLRRETKLVLAWTMIPFAFLALWAALSTAVGLGPLRSLFGRSTAGLSLSHIVMYCALGFLAVQLLDSVRRMRIITWTAIASGTLVGVVALMQQVFHSRIYGLAVDDWLLDRGFSTLGNPDHLGSFLVVPLLLAGVLAACETTRNRQLAAVGCAVILVTATVGTLTRGAWVAVVFGVVLGVAILWRNLRANAMVTWLLVGLLVCLGAVILAFAVSDPVDVASRFEVPSRAEEGVVGTLNAISSDRINLWRSSLEVAVERPLTGTGPDAFELGWYPHAISPSTEQGEGNIATDPHSLFFSVLATMGVPAAGTWAVGIIAALYYGASAVRKLRARVPLSGTGLYYVAWFIAACALQVAMLFAAVTTPIVMYVFLTLAVLIRPVAKETEIPHIGAERAIAMSGILLAVLTAASIVPNARAELALSRGLQSYSTPLAREAVGLAPWNMDVQRSYHRYRARRVSDSLRANTAGAADLLNSYLVELEAAGRRQPHEYYYPSIRAQLLALASYELGDPVYGEAAVEAADDALEIMPESVLTRVHRALALSDLKRYEEMVETLEGYWENERTTSYPGVLYARGLVLAGREAEAEVIFVALIERFPEEASVIEGAQQQILEFVQSQ